MSASSGYKRAIEDVLCCSASPITLIWNGECGHGIDGCWDQHGLVTWQASLAERHLALTPVIDLDRTCTLNTIWLLGERNLDFAIFIAVETTVLVKLAGAQHKS